MSEIGWGNFSDALYNEYRLTCEWNQTWVPTGEVVAMLSLIFHD